MFRHLLGLQTPTSGTIRILDQEVSSARKRDLYRAEFAYVYASPDLLNPTVPVVVHGVDVLLAQGSETYVITLTTDDLAFDEAMGALDRFLQAFSPR